MDINIFWLKLPLKYPYKLSFGTIIEYDSIIVEITNDNGIFWGETTALPGYSWESAESIWQTINQIVINSKSISELKQKTASFIATNPFAVTAVLSALEKLSGLINYNTFDKNNEYHLVGFVQGESIDELTFSVGDLLKGGYRTLKIKLSKNIKNDINKIKIIQELVGSKAKLRLDANQAYSYEMAEQLLKEIDTFNIELFEQPFERDAWSLVKTLVKWSPIPIMLDESIWKEEDIEKASNCNTDFVKLKLMKHGSIRNTIKLAQRAQQLGLEVILGNGVQTDLGCIDECYIYNKAGLKSDGEMNGFLKINSPLFPSCLSFNDGSISIHPEKIKNFSLDVNFIHRKYTGFIGN